jgi:hypothetical protein
LDELHIFKIVDTIKVSMENFTIYNPTRVHFGKGVIKDLPATISHYGKKVLLVYGTGSVKRNGIYDQVKEQLSRAGAEVSEYSGIKSNPIIEDVDAAASLGREKQVDVILAVGGGSVIDSAKIISIAIPVRHTGWHFMTGKARPNDAIPLLTVLTLSATGTEMNRFAVVQNNATKEKYGAGFPLTYPRESFLDPSYTLTVPKNYTAYGIVDLTAHALEAYFGDGEATLSDRFVFSIIREAIEYGPKLMLDLENYSLREKIMYAATCALNNLTAYGRKNGDWGVHGAGHVLSVLYDVPHGASLSIVYPAWLRHHAGRAAGRISELGRNVFGTDDVEKTIAALENFFTSLASPVRLGEAGITGGEMLNEIYTTMIVNKVNGNHHRISRDDYRQLIRLMA